VSTKEEPHYPAENPKDLLQENRVIHFYVLQGREVIIMRGHFCVSLYCVA